MDNVDNKKTALYFFNFNNHVKPKIIENKSKNMVLNGRYNSYFKYVNDRYIGSPTNSSVNNGYCRLIYGQGLAAKNQNKKPLQWVELKKILSPEDLENIIKDFQVQGMAYIQVTKSKGNTLSSLTHISVDKIAPEIADENNVINGYWFCNDWKRQNVDGNQPVYIPSFGSSNEGREIYAIRPYQMGREYFSLPTYQSCLQYAELEEEISNFLIQHMKNGMSAGYVINIPNGQNFTDDEKQAIESKIKQKLTGSTNAGDFILNFAFGEEKISVEVLEISDAHDKWQFSSDEAQNKILVAHEVVSPLLFGIKDATGFSSNADELDVAEAQTLKRIIQPKQRKILNALEDILINYGINLDLYFKPLTEPKETIIEEQNTELSSQKKQASGDIADALIDLGEEYDLNDWVVLSEEEVNYDTDSHAHDLVKIGLTSTGTARPNSKSEQDSEDIVIRYRYVGNPNPQREFCRKMIQANKVYRKEDIIQMENKAVNPGWGLNGADTYSIWFYKGGGNCRHKWNRVIYLKKNGSVDVNSPLAQTITTSEARRRGYNVPTNDSLVSITPNNMPNNGFVNK